jgi:hypothetical protein
MGFRLVQIAMNVRDDSALGRFWAEALGWTISSEEPGVTNLEPEGFAYPDPIAVCIDILSPDTWTTSSSMPRTPTPPGTPCAPIAATFSSSPPTATVTWPT